MKRILIISPSNEGTIALCTLNLYKAFVSCSENQVKLVMVHKIENGYREFDDCEYYNDKVESSFANVLKSFHRISWLIKIKKNYKPDLTISTLSGCSTINILAGGNEKKIGIFHAPNTQVKHLPLQYYLSLISYRFIYPKLDKLFCVSESVKVFIETQFPWIDQSKLEVVYNTHPQDLIRLKAKEPLSNSEMELFSHNVFLFCGRLEEIKAPQRLVEAFIRSNLVEKDYHIVFLGSEAGITWSSLLEIASKHGCQDNMHYLGRVSNPYKYMARSKALVLSSRQEGLPGVLIESLILGIPVISTNSSMGVWEELCQKDKYQPNLFNIYLCDDGIITPNTNDESLNIEGLCSALQLISNHEFPVTFEFSREIESTNIVNKFKKNLL